jgi:hypothetical protein
MENARFPTKEEPSALDSANSKVETTRAGAFTPRQSRVLQALLTAENWIARESVDSIAGASNGPQIILELRRKVTGHDGIEMQKAEATDRDGRACKPGRYRLTALGRERALGAVMSNTGASA